MQNSNVILDTPEMKKQLAQVTEKDFIHGYVNGQRFLSFPLILEKTKFSQVSIDLEDFLTPAEIIDVEVSAREIGEGQAKRFRSVDEFLEELKTH
jgi:hypothetical protein